MNYKELYETPSTIVVDVKMEGVICQSTDGIEASRSGYGTANEEDWE